MRDRKITSKIMSSIPSKNTKPELLLGSELWARGLRYRKHYKITGKPDFVFVRKKIAVFCDGDFWHGNNWRVRGFKSRSDELKSYKKFWREKIKRNVERDKIVNKELRKKGWTVMRFWESSIKKDTSKVAEKILKKYEEKNI